MNKYWRFLRNSAHDKRESTLKKFYLFSNRHTSGDLLSVIRAHENCAPVKKNSLISTVITDKYVIQTDARPFKRRLIEPKIVAAGKKGLKGPLGRVVNTLVANKVGYPSCKLLACLYLPPQRRTIFVLEKIQGDTINKILTKENAEGYVREILAFMHQCCLKGIFHGDPNINNIIQDNHTKNLSFIDFELAIKLNADAGTGLALEMATVRGERLESFISEKRYRQMVLDYLRTNFGDNPQYARAFLKFFNRPLHSPDRTERLNAASLGKPDILAALSQ